MVTSGSPVNFCEQGRAIAPSKPQWEAAPALSKYVCDSPVFHLRLPCSAFSLEANTVEDGTAAFMNKAGPFKKVFKRSAQGQQGSAGGPRALSGRDEDPSLGI